jgi:hypothetical protein
VYEATGFAVPFLVELAVDESTPDRVGILNLLEAISHGTSYLDVHEPLFSQMGVKTFGEPGTPKYENVRTREMLWVERARTAVLDGGDQLFGLTKQLGDVAYAALAVLVRLDTRREEVLSVILNFLGNETRGQYRGGLLLLLGQLGFADDNLLETLSASARSGDRFERVAAGLAAGRLWEGGLPEELRGAMLESIGAFEVEYLFDKLPWDASECIDTNFISRRSKSDVDEAVGILLKRIESGVDVNEAIYRLLDLLFPRVVPSKEITNKQQLSKNQLRFLELLLDQFDNHRLHLNVCLSQYGLPESRRSLRSLVTGKAYTKLDDLYPDIGYADNPFRPRRICRLQSGDRIHSRYFGLGTVKEVEQGRYHTSIQVEFDEEGVHTLALNHSRKAFLIELASYWLIRFFIRNPGKSKVSIKASE